MNRLLFILLISYSLCVAQFSLDTPILEDSEPQAISSNFHAHDHTSSEVADQEHEDSDQEHVHRHSHGPGQPEHEHHHEHDPSQSPSSFPLLPVNLTQLIHSSETNFHHLALTSLISATDGFLKAVFRPPIAFA